MVEKFLVEESTEETHNLENTEEWKKICEQLGLDKQLSIPEKPKSSIPFVCFSTVMERVYRTLCPGYCDYKNYNRSTIPLEVLSLIALSEKEGYFKGIEIWYDDEDSDPIVVGTSEIPSKYGGSRTGYFLIARWGKKLPSFEALKKKAKDRYLLQKKSDINKRLSKAKQILSTLPDLVDDYIEGNGDEWSMSI